MEISSLYLSAILKTTTMHHLTQRQENLIKGLASKLQPETYAVKDMCSIKGEDVLLAGTDMMDGEKVDPEKEYQMTLPRYHEFNHLRRIRRASKKSGFSGFWLYIKKYIPANDQSNWKSKFFKEWNK
jgi:hypothetical protein